MNAEPLPFSFHASLPRTTAAPDSSALWFIRLRWSAAVAQTIFILCARYLFGFELPLLLLLAAVGVVAVSNLLLQRQFSTRGALKNSALEWTLLGDTLVLTFMLFLTGGAANPFSIIYLVHIILAAVVLGEKWTWVMTAISITLYGGLFLLGDQSHLMHAHSGSFSSHLEGMWLAFAFTAVLLAFFVNRILLALRARDSEAAELKLRVAKTEQFAALVNLAAGAAHELGTPLATIAVAAQGAQGGFTMARPISEQSADAGLIAEEIDRCKAILESMGGSGSDLRGEMPTRFSLAELRADLEAEVRGLSVRTDGWLNGTNIREMTLPRGLLRKSLLSLIRNSLDADPNGQIHVEAQLRNDMVAFRVSDRGCGIDASVMCRIGEPFLTTKPPGKGMGLGVFLVKIFAERMGGALRYQSGEPTGTVASLSLPLVWR